MSKKRQSRPILSTFMYPVPLCTKQAVKNEDNIKKQTETETAAEVGFGKGRILRKTITEEYVKS